MRPVALDTNAYTAFKRGDGDVVAILRQVPQIQISATVLGELLAGFAAGSKEADNRTELARFMASPRVSIIPVSEATADIYAVIYAALRRKGSPIPTNDLWIAASALQHGAALLSFDAHFAAIDGLKVGRHPAHFLL